jgi:hypothetical protein
MDETLTKERRPMPQPFFGATQFPLDLRQIQTPHIRAFDARHEGSCTGMQTLGERFARPFIAHCGAEEDGETIDDLSVFEPTPRNASTLGHLREHASTSKRRSDDTTSHTHQAKNYRVFRKMRQQDLRRVSGGKASPAACTLCVRLDILCGHVAWSSLMDGRTADVRSPLEAQRTPAETLHSRDCGCTETTRWTQETEQEQVALT